MKLKELQTIDAEELASQPLPPPSFIVDGLIPYGLCVLAGPSKCGKSWLMLWLCMRVSQGLPIWERKTQQCDVLYLCLEDTYARIQRRMYRLNEESVPELRLGVISEKLHCGLEKQIEQHLSKYPNTKLVVIDTLQKVRKPNSADSNMYAADYEDISASSASRISAASPLSLSTICESSKTAAIRSMSSAALPASWVPWTPAF